MRLNMTCLAPQAVATEKTLVKGWAIRLALEFVTPILRMDVVCRY